MNFGIVPVLAKLPGDVFLIEMVINANANIDKRLADDNCNE